MSRLSLTTCISCLVFRHLLSNSTRPFSCASHLAQLAIHNSASPCLKSFEHLLAIFVHRLLGHLPNRNTTFSDISSRYCNSVMPTFTSSLLSRYLSNLSKATLRLRLSSIKTQWPSSSSVADGELCCGNGVVRVGARRGFCHCSLILNFMPLVLPTLLPCTVSPLTLQPSSSACHEVVRFLCW